MKNGRYIVAWMPKDLYEIFESARKRLGMNRSAFIKFCILRALDDFQVLTAEMRKEVTRA